MNKIVQLTVLITCIALFLSACWSRVELQELLIVEGVGVEKSGEQINWLIKVTPTTESTAESQGSTSGGSEDKEGGADLFQAKGNTTFAAARNIVVEASRKPYYSHTSLFLFNADLATEGIKPALDLWARDFEPRLTANFGVALSPIREIFSIKPRVENTIVKEIEGILDIQRAAGESISNNVNEVLLKCNEFNGDFVAPLITIEKGDNNATKLKAAGSAVFRDSKFVGTLTAEETKGLNFVLPRQHVGFMEIASSGSDIDTSIEIRKEETKRKAVRTQQQLIMHLEVAIEARVSEYLGPLDLTSPDTKMHLEKLTEQKAEELIRNSFDICQQQYQSDVYNFMGDFQRAYPKDKDFFIKNHRQLVSNLQLDISVQCNLTDTGLKFGGGE